MKFYSLKVLCSGIAFFLTVLSYGQSTKTVTGTVTDENGMSMPGVNVLVQGTTTGTQTDFDGKYSIKAALGNTLIFSYVGKKTIEFKVGEDNQYDVVLKQAASDLDEVVVVGYGTSRKRDITGSISRVKEEEFNKGVNISPDQLIQGKASGVNVVQNSGAPGGGVTFRIRGASSIRSGSQPLFVVDGVPLDGRDTKPSATAPDGGLGNSTGSNPLNFLNPNDIASIDILKDASATAIYGSRGANGVVIITTKRGKSGKPSLAVDFNSGVSTYYGNPDVMDGDTYRRALADRGLEQYDGKGSINAFDAITRMAITNKMNMSISGGSDKGNYRVSAGYLNKEGVVKKTELEKFTANLTGTYRFLPEDRLKIDVSLVASNTVEQGGAITNDSDNLISGAIAWNPTVPLRNPNGTYVQRNYEQEGVPGVPTNPLALVDYFDDNSNITNILGSVTATVKLFKGLNYKLRAGVNQSKGNRTTDISGDLYLNTITDLGLAQVSASILTSSTITNTFNYKEDFGNFNLNALLGYEFQDYKKYSTNITAKGFTLFDVKGSDILQNASKDNISVNSYRDPSNQLQSFFGRANLNYNDRYLITVTMRADGSTKFGSNNKYGYFPSFAGAWVLSGEEFMAHADNVDNLKLRFGWGRTGNQEFPTGASQQRYTLGQQRISLTNVANPNLKWETSETYNLGLDYSFFEGAFSGSIEVFDKTTNDLLFQLPAIQPAPAAQYWTNLDANIKNRGVEFSTNVVVKETDNFQWSMGGNITYLKNKFRNYQGSTILTGQITGNGLDQVYSQRLANNKPLYSFKMYRYEGLDEDGLSVYSEEEEFVGNPNPDFLIGLNTNLSYGDLNFNMSFNGALGHQLYNSTANSYVTAVALAEGRNTSSGIAFSDENIANANQISTRYLEDGDFLRLQYATLTYDLTALLGGDYMSDLRISLTGQNLFVLTDYSGFDPEVNTDRGVDGVPSFGIEYVPYPRSRTFLLGLSVKF